MNIACIDTRQKESDGIIHFKAMNGERLEPLPLSAETQAEIWLSLRKEGDDWTADEEQLYALATRHLLLASNITAIFSGKQASP